MSLEGDIKGLDEDSSIPPVKLIESTGALTEVETIDLISDEGHHMTVIKSIALMSEHVNSIIDNGRACFYSSPFQVI